MFIWNTVAAWTICELRFNIPDEIAPKREFHLKRINENNE